MTDRATWTLPRTIAIAIAVAALAAASAHAQLKIEITSGVTDPIPIAIIQFARAIPADGGLDVAAIVQQDLEGSGRFRAMPRSTMRVMPVRGNDVVIDDWRADGNDYALVGRVSPLEGTQLAVDFELINLLNGQRLASQRFTGTQGALRNAAHRVSDVVYEKIVGVRGAFATRIAYVSVDGAPPARRWQLIIADADGENFRPITESRRPIMSPAWSPDGQWLAYVSFENRASGVFVQRVKTGERRQVSARAGINGAPAWSPDGSTLALTLSRKDGDVDIYTLRLGSQTLTRMTFDPGIDTEPAWSGDGRKLYFMSDRAGGPQIYELDVDQPNRATRVTFEGTYNARPRLSPDGKQLAVVHLDRGNFRIATVDLQSKGVQVLSPGRQDESPSFAPNGATLIYATQDRGRGVLATVSVDGRVQQRLAASTGDVREPVWSPFPVGR